MSSTGTAINTTENRINYYDVHELIEDFYGLTPPANDPIVKRVETLLNTPTLDQDQKFDQVLLTLTSACGTEAQPVRLTRILMRTAGYFHTDAQLARKH